MSLATRMTGDFAPLRPRLGALFVLRLALAIVPLVVAGAFSSVVGMSMAPIAIVTAAYLVISVFTETVRQWRGSQPLSVVGAGILLDGLFIACVVTLAGGPGSSLSFLLYVHLIAVTLLASYRTGLKVAVWQSLLLVVAHYIPQSVTSVAPLSVETAVFAVVAFLTVAVATATFSGLNERELRRSRAGFRALAEMAGDMEDVHNPDEVVATLLRALPSYFGPCRAALYLREEGTVTTLVGDRVSTMENVGSADAVVARCWTERRPVLLKQLDPTTNPVLTYAVPAARNVVVLPMTADGESVGALLVEQGGRAGASIGSSAVAMLTQFAAHAALSHRNVRLMAEIKHLATVDGLTGLSNRRTFEAALQREVARALRSGDDLSLLLVDVDHFKRVNDNHGHPMGDEVLRHVGRALSTHGRELDLPARYGGEEFAVLLPGCSPEEAMGVAERLRAAIASEESPLPVTASVGLAAMHRNASDAESLVKAADEALYEAKQSGRNRTTASTSRHLRAVGAA